jgi:TPR repeat protein
VWTSYSARHAAQLIGLPESAIRSCIRDGLVGTPGTVPAQLTFRDLSALRTVKALVDAGLPLPRVRRELTRIQLGLPDGASIAELTIEARGGQVHIRGAHGSEELGGQLALPFDPAVEPPSAPAGELRMLPRPPDGPLPVAVAPTTAEQWLARACQLEDRDPVAAIDAYRRALRLRPECTEAWINLGRMFAESGDPSAAHDCFRSAVELDPTDATAYYNLGVISQDTGKEEAAIGFYRRALELDPRLAEAHYNLATLFDQSGDARAAIRHINEYRKLTR